MWTSVPKIEYPVRMNPSSPKARAFCSGSAQMPAPSCPFGDAKRSPPALVRAGGGLDPTLPTAPTLASSANATRPKHTIASPANHDVFKVAASSEATSIYAGVARRTTS
jgi:hypothetical protein